MALPALIGVHFFLHLSPVVTVHLIDFPVVFGRFGLL
jgi:hypothetical protein